MAVARAIIDVDINTSPAAAALRQLQTQVNAFQTALNRGNVVQGAAAKEYSRSLSDLVNSTRYFTAETVRMRTSAAQLDDTLRKGQGSISQYFNALKKGTAEYAAVTSLAQQRAAALQTQFVATGAAAGGYRDALAIRPIQAFSDATSVANQRIAVQRALFNQATTSMINFGKNTQWAGRQLMVGFTVPLTIFGTLAGKTFMDLEKQAIAFKKVYGDAFTTPEELDANIKAVRELSAEFTKYGIAASDTMEMAAQAAAAGAKNADLIDATTEATRLATLGQMEQTKALEATISLQNAFGLSSERLTKSINFMNMVENQTVLTLQDMAEAIPRVAPVIKGLGGSVEEMAAMLAAMKEGGVSAAQGANALKSGLASLINPTNRAVESLGKMGINLNNIIKSNQGDIMGTVQAFARELGKLDQLSQQQVLENVFGKYQYARLGALFKNIIKDGTQASRVLDMAGMSAQQLAATAEKELGVIAESPATKLTAAIERLKLSLAPVGEMFVRIATPVIEIFTRLLDIFNGLPDSVKKIGAIGTIIVGVLIPAGTMFLGLLMNLVGTLLKFGNIFRVAFQGFVKGGLKGAVTAVSQSLRYMSIQELETAEAAQQLGKAADAVSGTLVEQVGAAGGATRAIDSLAGAYARLALRMEEAAAVSGAFATPGAAMVRAGRGGKPPVTVVRRNTGGTIPGSGNKDTVPAMLTPGEFVVNKDATAQNLPLLHAINSGQAQGFNMGGGVAKKGRTFYGRFQSRLGIDPRLLAIGEELDITHQRQVQDAAALGFFIPGQRQRSSTSAGMTLHNAHFGAPRLGTSQAEQLARMRTGNNRVALGVELVRAGVPVTALTDDWATVSRRLNIGANRSENEKMSIAQAINELEFINAKDIIRLGPAMQREMITPEEFYTGLLRQLSLYDPNTQFTDAIFTNARNAALADLGKKVRPKITGLRIPTQVDLKEFVGGLRGVDPQTAARIVQDADIARELSTRGFDYISAADRPLIMSGRTGLREETGRSSGYHFAEGIPMMNRGGLFRGLEQFRMQTSGARSLKPRSNSPEPSRSSRIYGEAYHYEGFATNPLSKRSGGARGSAWMQLVRNGYVSMTEVDDLFRQKRVAAHGVSPEFIKRFGGKLHGAYPVVSSQELARLTPNAQGKLPRGENVQVLPSTLVSVPEPANVAMGKGRATREQIGELSGLHMLSLMKFLSDNGVPADIGKSIAHTAARRLYDSLPDTGITEGMWAKAIFDAEDYALETHRGQLQKSGFPLGRAIRRNAGGMIPKFARGGIAGIGSALKAWSTSSKHVRQTPSLLDPIEKLLAISKLPKQTRVGRRTAVGLAKGSEFDPEVADFLLKASPEELARVTSLSMRGPLSTTTGTYAGIDPDISRIMFLRQQHAVGRKRYLDDLKVIKSLEQKIASGRGPVGLYQRQLAERKARVSGYRASAHAIGREIKALAPRGYRILDLSMDLPAGTSAFTSRGSYMGKKLDESEIVLGSGTYPISSIQARNTGGQIFDSTQTSRRVVPGTGNRDTVPAMLTPGEFVINKQATAQNKELLHAINNGMNIGGTVQKFKEGGHVQTVSSGSGREYVVRGGGGQILGTYQSQEEANARLASYKQEVKDRANRIRKESKGRGMAGRGMGMGMGMGAIGGALMMAPMMPGIGENAVASTALSSAGMGINMLSMLPMMGVGGPATLAIAGIAAAATAAGVALYKWRDNIDSSARKAAEFGANLGGTANALNNVASILGQQTPAQRQAQLQLGLSEQEVKTLTESPEFANIFSSEEGQKFITDLQEATSAERFKKLSDYLTYAIAAGMMDATTAKAFAKGISAQIGDAVLGSQVSTAISGTEAGPKALVGLGEKRIAESQAATSKVINENNVSYEESSRAIGAATQIIQDFSNAEALAQEQFAMGTISYQELNSVVTQSRDVQAEYTRVIQDAMQKTSDFGGTMQATKDQLINAGLVTEEGFKAIEDVATKTVAAGRVGGVAGRGVGMGAVGQASTKVTDKQLLANATAAIAAGMSQPNVEQITADIAKGKGAAFDIYQSGMSKGLRGAQLLETVGSSKQVSEMVSGPSGYTPGFNPQEQVQKIVADFSIEGGDPTALASLIASLPAEGTARYDFLINLSGLDPEQQQQTIADFQNLANLLGTEFATQFTASSQYQEALKNGTAGALIGTIEQAASVFGENTQKIIDYANKTGMSLQQLTQYGKDLASMPQDLEIRLGVDMNNPEEIAKFGPFAAQLTKQWPILQNLNPKLDLSLYAKFLTVDEKGKPLSATETANRTKRLNQLFKTFESTKDSEVKKKVMLELIKLEDGKENTKMGDISQAYDSLIKRFGKKKIMNLPSDVLKKVVGLQIDLKPLKKALKEYYNTLNRLAAAQPAEMVGIPTGPMKNIGRAIAATRQQISLIQDEIDTTVESAQFSGGETTGGGGGGGGGQKSIGEQLQEQLDTLKSVFNSIRALLRGENKNFKNVMAGPFAPEFIEYLKGQGEAGIKMLKERGAKFNEAYKKFVQIQLQTNRNFLQNLPVAFANQAEATMGRNRAQTSLVGQGLTEEQAQSVIESLAPGSLALYNRASRRQAKGKKLTKEQKTILNQVNNLGGRVTGQAGRAAYEGMMGAFVPQERQQALSTKLTGMGFSPEVKDKLIELGVTAQMSEKRIANIANAIMRVDKAGAKLQIVDTLATMKRDAETMSRIKTLGFSEEITNELAQLPGIWQFTNDEIRAYGQQLQDIKMKTKSVADLTKEIADLDLQRVETEREIYELEKIAPLQKLVDAKARDIELRQRDLEAIDETIQKYQDQKDAITEVYNQQIKALEEIEKANDRIRQQQQDQLNIAQALSRGDVSGAAQAALTLQQNLAKQREQETRNALEMQYQARMLEIDRLINIEKEKRKVIEEDIKRMQKEQRDLQDDIYDHQQIINTVYDTTNQRLGTLRDTLRQINDELERAKRALADAQAATPTATTSTTSTSAAATGSTAFGANMLPFDDPAWDALAKIDWSKLNLGFSMGGKIRKFATGSWVPGTGNTDSVPAMLTPGEFVVRKSVAQEFGPLLTALNGDVFPKMRGGANIGVNAGAGNNEVQYNYDINVNVAGTNASPDEIANAVMGKIKMMEDRKIRSYKY